MYSKIMLILNSCVTLSQIELVRRWLSEKSEKDLAFYHMCNGHYLPVLRARKIYLLHTYRIKKHREIMELYYRKVL